MLSQYTGVAEERETPISCNSHRNQRSSEVVSARARYSASVLERATTVCFLLCQEMTEVPSRKQ
jgi:hypothetical protein